MNGSERYKSDSRTSKGEGDRDRKRGREHSSSRDDRRDRGRDRDEDGYYSRPLGRARDYPPASGGNGFHDNGERDRESSKRSRGESRDRRRESRDHSRERRSSRDHSRDRRDSSSYDRRDRVPRDLRDSGPYERVERVPYERRDSGPYERVDIDPYERRDSVPYERRDSGPYERRDSVPYERRDSVPYERPEAVPYVRPDAVPYERLDIDPYERRDGVPLEVRERDPYVRRDSAPQEFPGIVPRERRDSAPLERRDSGSYERKPSIDRRPSLDAGGNGYNLPGPSGSPDEEGALAPPPTRGGPRGERGGRGGRGGGRGGRGGIRGEGRGARRGRREEEYDLVVTRPQAPDGQGMLKKQANIVNGSRPVKLQGNFFKVDCRTNWCIYHYRVDFMPEETDTRIKKRLLKVHGNTLGAYIFDGASLYVSHKIEPDPLSLISVRELDRQNMELTIRLVAELAPTDVMYLQFFNIIVRKCLEGMELEEMGRHFYDRHQAVRIEAHHLELWPGYKTSMRNHEKDILLGVEITHKVLRLDNCLQVMTNLRGRFDDPRKIRDELVGTIVMTVYNRKTYRIDDIDWDTTPSSSFDMRGRQVTFVDYFREKYNLTIHDPRQPMLVSRPKKRDFHRGMTGPILLIPELCQMTGLTDEMRGNNNLMRALASHLHTDPLRRVEKLRDFMRRLRQIPPIQEELQRWGLKFQERLVEFEGHVVPKENILFGDHQHEVPNDRYDWGQAFRNKPMLTSVPLRTWVVIVPSRDAHAVDRLVSTMQRVARPLRFNIAPPADVRKMGDVRPNDYAKAVDTVMNEFRDKIQMIFVILPRQVTDVYSAVKKRACMEFGIPSQCFVARNAHNEKGIMSICTKIVVQMNAKLGGEPWSIQIPLKKLMIVGFDVYHCGKRKGASVGAMVATTAPSQAKYFSTISYHSNRDDLSEKMGADFTRCLHAFQKINQDLPDRIIMYRDGVGDGQLKYVYETELKMIEGSINSVYSGCGKPIPKFTFIVVTKRINTRIFGLDNNRPINPGPGTIADDVITLPERYDFFLVSQYSRQGTVSPVSYNVIHDRQGLDADKIQRLTFKLCHMYFNWSGTVTVPAPCQYAHKLAYLTGLALGGPSSEKLSNLLYYL